MDPDRRYSWILQLVEHKVAQVLGMNPGQAIPSERPLQELGLDSLMAVELRRALTDATALPLATTVAFDYPTLDALASHLWTLWSRTGSQPSPVLVTLRPGTSGPPLFILPGAWGGLLGFSELASSMRADRPVLGLELEAIEPENRTTLEKAAARFIREIREHYPNGPYYLLGFSSGGHFAYEMALQMQGEVTDLFLLDSYSPEFQRSSGSKLSEWVPKLKTYAKVARMATPAELRHILRSRWRRGSSAPVVPTLDYRLSLVYVLSREDWPIYPGRTHLIRYSFQPRWMKDPQMGWSRITPNLVVHEIVGTHGSMGLQKPVVGQIASILDRVMGESPQQDPMYRIDKGSPG
jgi:thioesterase domain-containing protein/acyl carrier protein